MGRANACHGLDRPHCQMRSGSPQLQGFERLTTADLQAPGENRSERDSHGLAGLAGAAAGSWRAARNAFSNPGKMALKKALRSRLITTSQVLICGDVTSPRIVASVATFSLQRFCSKVAR